jgi:hypothetical protein
MLRVLRITLMWLIALAIPIQGSAAVTMFGCGPGHHGGMGSSQTAMSDEHASGADHHSAGAVDDEVESHHHDGGALQDHSHSLEAHGTAHKVAKGNCTPCASCCVVAALPATVIQFEPVPLVDCFVPSAQSGVISFLADGLERPPRLFLA